MISAIFRDLLVSPLISAAFFSENLSVSFDISVDTHMSHRFFGGCAEILLLHRNSRLRRAGPGSQRERNTIAHSTTISFVLANGEGGEEAVLFRLLACKSDDARWRWEWVEVVAKRQSNSFMLNQVIMEANILLFYKLVSLLADLADSTRRDQKIPLNFIPIQTIIKY